jgi:hypothetical protein
MREGGFFEGDFEITQHLLDRTPMDYLFNKKLYAAILPTLSRPLVACGADLVAQTKFLGLRSAHDREGTHRPRRPR